MAFTYYRYDDASAPTLTGQVGSLVALLDAVLVTGYGSKSAAGWTKPYTGSNKAVFRMAVGGGKNGHYLRVLDDGTITDGAARTAAMIGYTTMSTVDVGTGDFPLVGQRSNSAGLLFTKSDTTDTTARPWLVVADDTFFLIYSWQTKTTFDTVGPAGRQSTFYFGQGDAFDSTDTLFTVINGRNSSTYTDTIAYQEGVRVSMSGAFASVNRQFILANKFNTNPSLPSSLAKESAVGAASGNPSGPLTDPEVFDGKVGYSACYICEREPTGSVGACATRGKLPLLMNPDGANQTLSATSMFRFFDTFAGEGVDAGKTFIVIAQYLNSTAYHVFLQTTGSR